MHKAHSNSLQAHYEERENLSKRCNIILKFFQFFSEQEFTDRQVQKQLGFAERNQVQPRITELVGSSYLVETGKVKCDVTGKQVRTVKAL